MLRKEFTQAALSSQPAVFVRTDEQDDAILTMSEVAADTGAILLDWNCLTGATTFKKGAGPGTIYDAHPFKVEPPAPPPNLPPVIALKIVLEWFAGLENRIKLKGSPDYQPVQVILVVRNMPEMGKELVIRQLIQNSFARYKKDMKMLVAVGDADVDLPRPLAPLFMRIQHELPDEEELRTLALGVLANMTTMPTDQVIAEAVAMGRGLTRHQFEGAVSMCLVSPFVLDDAGRVIPFDKAKHTESAKLPVGLHPSFIWTEKVRILNEDSLVEVLEPVHGFDKLGGLRGLKDFVTLMLRGVKTNPRIPAARPNGILLVSQPGMGKTTIISAAAKSLDCPAVMVDFGAMMQGVIGESEKAARRALAVVDSLAPPNSAESGWLIVGFDEIEKMLPQTASSNDSGVGGRLLGYVLQWLSKRRSRTFVIATANNADNLHAALTRSERFDCTFFLEEPAADRRRDIWNIWLKHFERPTLDEPGAEPLPPDDKWVGADILSCVRLSCLMGTSLVEAADYVVTTAEKNPELYERLSKWATTACVSAETGRRVGKKVEAPAANTPGSPPAVRPSRTLRAPKQAINT